MKLSSTSVYRRNRANFPLEELRKRNGQWVAFNVDGSRIVASAETVAELARQVEAAHEDLSAVVLEYVEVEDMEIALGAAELSYY